VAQKITTLFIDDIDGGLAEGTVRLALDVAEYEIDLVVDSKWPKRSQRSSSTTLTAGWQKGPCGWPWTSLNMRSI
jgi:Lsr2